MNENGIIRSIEEITASARLNMQDMVNRAIALGHDLSDAKEQLGHGKFLPWLKELGISSSAASNYMRVAREITPGSRLASLPYSKALALLSAPAEEREELAEKAEDKSAAEIRKLIEERNRAAEAANAETTRADQAEADAKEFSQENANLRNKISVLNNELNKANQYSADLQKALAEAEQNKPVEVEKTVEVPPADYEQLKRTQADLLRAAEEAEQRANEAEDALEKMLMENGGQGEDEVWKTLKIAVTRFMNDCEFMALDPMALKPKRNIIDANVTRIEHWCVFMREALDRLDAQIEADGVVSMT